MIKYALACNQGHQFESWFSDSLTYDRQSESGLVECPHCGSSQVEKALMAPAISTSKRKARNSGMEQASGAAHETADETAHETFAAQPQQESQAVALLDEKQRAVRDMIRDLHAKISENSVDVGASFVDQARKMHDGDVPTRAIRGEATFAQAKELWDEGVPVMPIPVLPEDRN